MGGSKETETNDGERKRPVRGWTKGVVSLVDIDHDGGFGSDPNPSFTLLRLLPFFMSIFSLLAPPQPPSYHISFKSLHIKKELKAIIFHLKVTILKQKVIIFGGIVTTYMLVVTTLLFKCQNFIVKSKYFNQKSSFSYKKSAFFWVEELLYRNGGFVRCARGGVG